jgi:Hemerythrin HHE cation binding domain
MSTIETITPSRLRPVAVDLYRDIHKGIRSELFSLVVEAGRVDPADDCDAAALTSQVHRTVQLLVDHAEHEDGVIQPILELHAPALAARVADDHLSLEWRLGGLGVLATEASASRNRRALLHELYIELAAFTADYLRHQDIEEREVGPTLEEAVGVDGVIALHMAIIGNMAPQQLISGLAVMFPAMNVDDRTELLGGMKATAPAEAFEGVWSLAGSVLSADDHRALAARLSLA